MPSTPMSQRFLADLAEALLSVAPPGFRIETTREGLDLAYRGEGVEQLVTPIIDQAEGTRDQNIETAARSVMGGMQQLVGSGDQEWPAQQGETGTSAPSAEAEVRGAELHLWWADASARPVLTLPPINLEPHQEHILEKPS
jgi:hypothetical protein